ncbi:MAG: MobQ family relaxase, partial [Muricoprocola sp.]
MSLYHFSVKQVSRGKGQTVVNSAAYISGKKLHNDYYEEVHDYTRKRGVIYDEIMLPDYVPDRFSDRQTLWNEVEFAEKGKKAQLAYSFDIALQNELTMEENIELAREFCQEQFVSRGMTVDMAVHEGKSSDLELADNPHFHVLIPIRPMNQDGTWGKKQRREYKLDEDGNRIRDENGKYIFSAVSTTGWNSQQLLEVWRSQWADKVNMKFKENGLAARIDHRSYEKQGIELIPTIHERYEVRAMEKKGIRTVVGDLNRAIRKLNEIWIQLKESLAWAKTFREEVSGELYRRANPTLMESLQDYYEKRDKVADTYQYGSQKAHLTNLKEFAEAVNYLTVNQITTVEQLNQKLEDLQTITDGIRSEIRSRRGEIVGYRELMDYDQKMKKIQPVMDKYNKIFFKSSRQKYYSEHKKQIDQYRMCERRLKPYWDAEGKLPVAQWKKEQKKLEDKNQEANIDLTPYDEELKMVRKVQRCVDIMLNEKNRQQSGDTG